jgi:hypothetical protein
MNGFLLLCSMTMDDLPLRLFATEEEFGAYMLSTGDLLDDINTASKDLFIEGSELVALWLVEFRDGKPVGKQYAMDISDLGDQ